MSGDLSSSVRPSALTHVNAVLSSLSTPLRGCELTSDSVSRATGAVRPTFTRLFPPVCGVQLLGWLGLQGHGEVLQGFSASWLLGVFWRVQPNWTGGTTDSCARVVSFFGKASRTQSRRSRKWWCQYYIHICGSVVIVSLISPHFRCFPVTLFRRRNTRDHITAFTQFRGTLLQNILVDYRALELGDYIWSGPFFFWDFK